MQRQRSRVLDLLAAASVLVFASAATASAEPPADRGSSSSLRACIDPPSSDTSWTPYDDHTILVRSGRQAFRITTNRCPSLADPLPRITTKVYGGSQICSPHDVQLFVSGGGESIPVPCFIQSITPLSEDQAKALERRRH
jgi:hypothetical protein